MTIVLETSYRHGELDNLLAKLKWTKKLFSEKSGLSLAAIDAVLTLKRRPTSEENEAIFECFAREGYCLDLLSSWQKNFALPENAIKQIDSKYADSELLVTLYPGQRIAKLGQNLEFEPADRIDACLFLDEIKKVLSPDEIIIFRSLLEGMINREIAEKYCYSDRIIQSSLVKIRKKICELLCRLEVSEEHFNKLMVMLVDHSYALAETSWRSVEMWKEKNLPKTRATITKFSDRIRIRFVTKPDQMLRGELLNRGWRYNDWNFSWYHNLTSEALAFAMQFEFEEMPSPIVENQKLPFRQDELF
jgi:hypothetical protein